MLVRPGDAQELATQVEELWKHPDRLLAMRLAARKVYETRLTARASYQRLMDIYRTAVQRRVGCALRA
jgi:glycosyltransferase involved in cell wall biosynthesis